MLDSSRRFRLLLGGLAFVLVVGACDDPEGPDPVGAHYTASTFVNKSDVEDVDLLALGAMLDITLWEDGTTTGTLFVPDGDEGGNDFEASMAGTWRRNGNQVEFDQEADTFVRDLVWTDDGFQLTAENGDVRVVLSQVLEPYATR